MNTKITCLKTISSKQALELLIPAQPKPAKTLFAALKDVFNPLPKAITYDGDQNKNFIGKISNIESKYVYITQNQGADYQLVTAINDKNQTISFLLNLTAASTLGIRLGGLRTGDIISAYLIPAWLEVKGAKGWLEADEIEVLASSTLINPRRDQLIISGMVKDIGQEFVAADWPFCKMTVEDFEGHQDTFWVDGGYRNCQVGVGQQILALLTPKAALGHTSVSSIHVISNNDATVPHRKSNANSTPLRSPS